MICWEPEELGLSKTQGEVRTTGYTESCTKLVRRSRPNWAICNRSLIGTKEAGTRSEYAVKARRRHEEKNAADSQLRTVLALVSETRAPLV